MIYLFELLITINALLIGHTYALTLPDHSVETCFTSDNRPAVCVDPLLCKSAAEELSSLTLCSDGHHVCCPSSSAQDSRESFVVYANPWDWGEWLINWTNSKPNPTFPPINAGNNQIIINGTLPPVTEFPVLPNSNPTPACGARLNIRVKDNGDDELGYIVGGNVAQAHSWPWNVALYSGGRFICGGSVIDQRYVLCAAHCVSHSGRITKAETLSVLIGAHDRRSSGTQYKVEKVIVHSGYNEKAMSNDISLFKLAQPIQFGKTVSPVCLPQSNNDCAETNKPTVYLAGWGTTSTGGSTSNELREVSVPMIPIKDCQKAYDTTMVTNKNICAGLLNQGGKDTCQGDSGGPMSVRPDSKQNKFIQCGIVSWGRGCAEARYPGVYTKVSEYTDWIRANKV